MKILLFMMSIMILMKKFSMSMLILSILIMLSINMMTNQMMMNMSFSMDFISLMMVLLSLISTLLIILSSNNYYKIMNTIIPIMLILTITFTLSNMVNFYMMFELVLIPTMILIMSEGKQPERLQASIYLMMYTIMASLPLLISIIYLINNFSFSMSYLILLKFNMIIFLMLAFLAKMPMYFLHLWLPKAHVEAPLEGSMILAAVLLKLGGYGLIRFMPLCISKINNMNLWIISISLIGMMSTGLNCLRQKDLKSLIAYSSVAHMSFVLMGIFSMNKIGLTGVIIMMIAHGLSSSALFLLVNDLYYKYSSRNILSFKGLINMMPNMNFWWFIFMAINISAPPTINTISEILLLSSIINWNTKLILIMFMASLLTAMFSMSMYINISHNKNNMMPSEQTQQKIHLSLFLHSIILLILLMKMETML